MSAQCWGCEFGVAMVGVPEQAGPLDPIGTCWECHVFGCRGHGRRDAGAGKWLCYPSVAKVLAVSAGIEQDDVGVPRFANSAEFEARFPELAAAAKDHRSYWRAGPGEGRLGAYLQTAALPQPTKWDLLGDALGVGTYLLAREPHAGRADLLAEREPRAADVLSPALSTLINELERG